MIALCVNRYTLRPTRVRRRGQFLIALCVDRYTLIEKYWSKAFITILFLFICLSPINVETVEPIKPKYLALSLHLNLHQKTVCSTQSHRKLSLLCATHITLGKVYGVQIQNIDPGNKMHQFKLKNPRNFLGKKKRKL